jgi:hypothetical protein
LQHTIWSQFVLLEKSRLYLAKKRILQSEKKKNLSFFPEKFVLAGGTAAMCKTRSHIILAPLSIPQHNLCEAQIVCKVQNSQGIRK